LLADQAVGGVTGLGRQHGQRFDPHLDEEILLVQVEVLLQVAVDHRVDGRPLAKSMTVRLGRRQGGRNAENARNGERQKYFHREGFLSESNSEPQNIRTIEQQNDEVQSRNRGSSLLPSAVRMFECSAVRL